MNSLRARWRGTTPGAIAAFWLGILSACADEGTTTAPSTNPAIAAQLKKMGSARLMLRLRRAAWTAPRNLQGRVHYRSRRSAAVSVEYAALDALQADPNIERIDFDSSGEGHLAESLPLAGVTPVQAEGARGRDVTVALLDTGVDTTHPDLVGRVAAEACFCSTHCCPSGADTELGAGSALDDNGHGTHLAASIASQGNLGPTGGAPDAKLIAIKVLDSGNRLCCASDVVAALDWLSAEHPEVRVVNMSFGLNTLHAGDCDPADANTMALADAVDALRARGVLVIASSGNHGSSFSMTAPACIRSVLSVGATWDAALGPQLALGCSESNTAADLIACFSNASDTTDLVAPGALITASWPGASTLTRAGTSEASAIVAACAADLLSALPELTPQALENALVRTGKALTDPRNHALYAGLQCQAALASLRPLPAADSGGPVANDADPADMIDAGWDASPMNMPADAAGRPAPDTPDAMTASRDASAPAGGADASSGTVATAGRKAPPNPDGQVGDEPGKTAAHVTRAVRVKRPSAGSCMAIEPRGSTPLDPRLAAASVLSAALVRGLRGRRRTPRRSA